MAKRAKDISLTFAWPDTHAPYHDETAVNVALAAIHHLQPDQIVCLGDLYDFYACSFYTKDPKRRHRLVDEIEEGHTVRDTIDSFGLPVTLTLGNHEHRLSRYIREKAPVLDGFVSTEADIFPSRWKVVSYGDSHRIGKVLYSHDFGRSGDQAAHQGLVDVGANIAFGHTHQLGLHILGQQRGVAHVGMSCGWLGSLQHIDYKHAAVAKRRYHHGFGLVYHNTRTGNAWMVPVPILNGRCVVEGKEIRV